MTNKRILTLITLLLFLFLLAGCDWLTPPKPVEYLSTDALDNEEVTVAYGTTEDEALSALDATVGILGSEDEIGIASIAWTIEEDYDGEVEGNYEAIGVLTLPEDWLGEPDDVTATVVVSAELPGELAEEEFGWVDRSHPCGQIIGYYMEFVLTDATFKGIKSMVVKLYSGDTLLQTNIATARVGVEIIGEKIGMSFDIFGIFDYVCDGFWINVRESEYGQSLSLPVTKVVATVTLSNGKVLTAENTNPTGI